MAQSDRDNESRELTEEFIEKIDRLTGSPSDRARFIWELLMQSDTKKLTNWDLICFCIETLGFMSTEFPWLKEASMAVSQIVYKAHYLNHDRILDSETNLKPVITIPKMGKK